MQVFGLNNLPPPHFVDNQLVIALDFYSNVLDVSRKWGAVQRDYIVKAADSPINHL